MEKVIYRAYGGVAGWTATFDTLEQAIEFCRVDAFFKDNDRAIIGKITTEYNLVENVLVESVKTATVWERGK